MIWNNIRSLVDSNANLVKTDKLNKFKQVMSGHPITGTRELFSKEVLDYLNDDIYSEFINKLNHWL